MDVGHYISGIGHGALLLWAMIGGLFSSVPDDALNVAEVSIISGEEFAALSAPHPAPEPPKVEDTPPPVDEPPEVVEITPPLVEDTVPDIPQPPAQDNPVVLAPPSDTASPRPSQRVAPTPAAPPEPDIDTADVARDETVPDPDVQTEDTPEPEAAPPEASERIITEVDQPPSSAPVVSARPSARPKRPKPPVETVSDTRDTPVENTPDDVPVDTPPTAAPTGPPVSGSEQNAFLGEVRRCWNVGALSSAALATKVVVRFELGRDGKPDVGSIHMTGLEGGTKATARQAYETARRAIIRCGVNGYNLPKEKYEHWKIINITFNPENMRLK